MPFQKFFENTIESKFIKNLVYNNNLPLLDVAKEGKYLIKNCSYLHNTDIIKCLKSGYFDEGHLNNEAVFDTTDAADCISTKEFYVNESIIGTTHKHLSRYSHYDSETHRALGDYLRWYRDFYEIDLMPFYNCWDYTFFQSIVLDGKYKTGYASLHGTANPSRVVAVPIKLNATYTICIDCPSEVRMKAAYYNGYNFINTTLNKLSKDLEEFGYTNSSLTDALPNNELKRFSFTSFNNPIKFKIDLSSQEILDFNKKIMYDFEKYLYLLIQIPQSCDSSIVVLEGDYKYQRSDIVLDVTALSDKELLNSKLITNLSLMAINNRNTYAFSNRLIEYLLLNVIDSQSYLKNNNKLAQRIAGLKETGIWNDEIRYKIFKKYVKSKQGTFDINGFVDRDIERMWSTNRLAR